MSGCSGKWRGKKKSGRCDDSGNQRLPAQALQLDRTKPHVYSAVQLAAFPLDANAASNSARRPLRGSHPFGKCGGPSFRANRRTGTGSLAALESSTGLAKREGERKALRVPGWGLHLGADQGGRVSRVNACKASGGSGGWKTIAPSTPPVERLSEGAKRSPSLDRVPLHRIYMLNFSHSGRRSPP